MRWLAYLFPVLVLCAAAVLLVVSRGGRDAREVRRQRPAPPPKQAVMASPSGAAAQPSRSFGDLLWRVERLRSDDQTGYEAMLDEARTSIVRDEAGFLSYFREAMRSADTVPARRSFFLVKALVTSVPRISVPIADLLALPPQGSPHGAPAPSLNLVKSFALDQIAETLPSEAERQRLQPSLEKVLRSEPDVAIARSAAVLLTRINNDDGAAVTRLIARRPPAERSAISAPD